MLVMREGETRILFTRLNNILNRQEPHSDFIDKTNKSGFETFFCLQTNQICKKKKKLRLQDAHNS